MTDRVCQQAISAGAKQNFGDFISNKSIVKISQTYCSIHRSILHVDSRQPMTTSLQIGIEVHPITTQRRQTITVPEELGKTIELMRRIEAIEQTILNVVRLSISQVAANAVADLSGRIVYRRPEGWIVNPRPEFRYDSKCLEF